MKGKKVKRKNRKWLMRFVCVSLFFIFHSSFFTPARAQYVEVQEPVEVKSVMVPKEHSATKALLLSIVPGAGQIYNGQAWKTPIIYGTFAVMGYFIHYNYTRMMFFKDEYLYRVNHNDTPDNSDYASYPTSNIYSLYNSYDQYFQLMVIITVGFYALNLGEMHRDGYKFYCSVNGVWLTKTVPVKYLER